MQKKSRISFGPGAASIILIVVILSMSVLGLLSLVNARNDGHLSDRSAQVIEAVYELNAQAEKRFAELDALVAQAAREHEGKEEILAALGEKLPEGVLLEDTTLKWTQEDEFRNLECAVDITLEDDNTVLTWTTHRMTMRTEDTWNLGSF